MNIDWVPFYEEFATKLLDYKDKRDELLSILEAAFDNLQLSFPFKERGKEDYVDICPFTVFGSFNKGLTNENRILILEQYKELFSVDADLPTGFDAIPVLNNLSAWFFAYEENRGEHDIDNLWGLFESAITLANGNDSKSEDEFIRLFNMIQKQKMVKWNITLGLFWIRPYHYLNLDSTNRKFLLEYSETYAAIITKHSSLKTPPSGAEYLNIIRDLKKEFSSNKDSLNNFIELSNEAFNYKPAPSDEPIDDSAEQYWMYSPGSNSVYWQEFKFKGIMAIGWDEIGDVREFDSKKEIASKLQEILNDNRSHKNDSLALWEFTHEIKKGDIIYVKQGRSKLIGRGIVTSDYMFEESRDNFKHVRTVEWSHNGEWDHPGSAALKTLTNISNYPDYITTLENLFDTKEREYPTYTDEDFLQEVFIDSDKYNTIISLLKHKKNIILQGPPGVGKTFAAKRLAYSLLREKDFQRVQMVQFHQSYSYEDFVMGYHPTETSFELVSGPFKKFCEKANEDDENDYFFIIDEINRGNLSKIFGELLMLIESEKRGKARLKLMYEDKYFTVPENLYIIGMMNTADRSLAMIDYALRRRFAFVDLEPEFESRGFQLILKQGDNPTFDRLIREVKRLNEEIKNDENLGEGFLIGHSYFCITDEVTNSRLKAIVKHEIIPLIREYWFDNKANIDQWSRSLLGVFHD